MKKLRFLSVLMILFASAGFLSCENEPLDSDLLMEVEQPGNNTPAAFKVNFSNDTYVATSQAAAVQGNSISVTGLRGTSGQSVILAIPGVTTGNYTNATMIYMTGGGTGFYSNMNPSNNTPNGSVTITSINTTARTISGTFNFTGYWSVTADNLPNIAFTEGSFTNVPYTGTIPGTNPNPNPPQEEYYRATVNGAAKDYSDDISILSSGGFMNLMGAESGNTMSITVNQNDGVGTYQLSANPFPGPTAFYSNGMGIFTSQSGTLTIISKQNGWIKGTFSFVGGTAPDVFNITNGEFNIEYE